MTPAEVGLRNAAVNTADDLESLGAVMIQIGQYVPNDIVQPDWFALFGRQIVEMSGHLSRAAREGDNP